MQKANISLFRRAVLLTVWVDHSPSISAQSALVQIGISPVQSPVPTAGGAQLRGNADAVRPHTVAMARNTMVHQKCEPVS
jgi:hypothetical protein